MRDDLDAATLRDLSDVAMGVGTAATRAALHDAGQELWTLYIFGDIDGETYLDALDDLMAACELLPETTRGD